MINEKVELLLNQQVTHELYSAQLYLSMSSWFSEKSLDGFAKWYYMQAYEEKAHAMIIYNYIIKAGGRALLEPIKAPPLEWDSVLDVLNETIKHEEFVTSLIYNIVDVARQEKDFKVDQFFQWFIDEQVEEEDNANKNKDRYETMGMDGKALYLLDQEMGTRVYTAPVLLTTLEAEL
ncbi:MAG: ferritin [Clostridiaceae bacterium]|jgi:ferritin|nr:ferritin [Clostridiaceae bacterium]